MAQSTRRSLYSIGVTALAGAIITVASLPAAGQQWRWPWEQDTQPAPRREAPSPPPTRFQSSNICLELEQRLAREVNRGRLPDGNRDALRDQAAQLSNTVRSLENQLDRQDCYEEFFFQRSLRNTRTCVRLHRQMQEARRKYDDVRTQYDQLAGQPRQSHQDEIIRALARNGCGSAYSQEARRIDRYNDPLANFFFQEENPYTARDRNTYRGLEFATYRTLCVRLCDGYYFPISFSTLPNYFGRDEEACQSRCAAPTALFYYQNPGSSIDQMVSVADRTPYRDLKNAFLYRKSFVQGCSCKRDEYADASAAVQSEDGSSPDTQSRERSPLSPIR